MLTIDVSPELSSEPEDDAAFAAHLDRMEKAIREECRRQNRELDEREQLLARCRMLSEALGTDPGGSPRYLPEDVLGWIVNALERECAMPKLGPAVLIDAMRCRVLPTAPFAARWHYLKTHPDFNAEAAARKVGLMRKRANGKDDKPDATYLERVIGVRPWPPSRGQRTLSLFISYERAVLVADALGMDYADLGL